MSGSRALLSIGIPCVLLGGLVWLFLGGTSAPTAEDDLRRIRDRFAALDFAEAERLAVDAASRRAGDARFIELAVRAARRRDRRELALEYLLDLETSETPTDAVRDAELRCAALLLEEWDRVSAAESVLRSILAVSPSNSEALERLGTIYALQGRSFEATELIARLLPVGTVGPGRLAMYGLREVFEDRPAIVRRWRTAMPDDPVPTIATARGHLNGRVRSAVTLLEGVVRDDPSQIEAWALLGRGLLELGDERRIATWHAEVPEPAERHPLVWVTRGEWARERGEPRVAVRCAWEAVRRAPESQLANHLLGDALNAAGEHGRGTEFLKSAAQLSELNERLRHVARGHADIPLLRGIAETMVERRRLAEARAWFRFVISLDAELAWAVDGLADVEDRVAKEGTRRTSSSEGLDEFPMPSWTVDSVAGAGASGTGASAIAFRDDAVSAGLRFEYANGDPDHSMLRMFEQIGGGIAAFDFDRDGRVDVFFTQGAKRPPGVGSSRLSDRLFRNRGGDGFEDVTEWARTIDTGFGGGVAVGDVNADGFPDLYVGNAGENRLFENNGDGTFTEVPAAAGTAGDDWSSSCVLVDMTGDALPDLYVVNYLAGDDVFALTCRDSSGRAVPCSPTLFEGAIDRVYVNRGDGRFDDVTESAGLSDLAGNGLGIVAFNSEAAGLRLAVANDQTPNRLLRPRMAVDDRLALDDEGVVAGFAFDGEGLTLAGMGIAAGDADGDGRVDLYVTNFSGESSTFCRQTSDGRFVDETRSAKLRRSSLPMLGFGTQFLDADRDGALDLVVVNGHVGRVEHEPFRMPPQCYRNLGDGRFAEVSLRSRDGYFAGRRLGRGLARLDWNRDGREDFVVTHLDDPAALLTNTTSTDSTYLGVRLVGTVSERDAVGATVMVDVGGRMITRQMLGGAGFQASNEARLVFGLGDANSVEDVSVRWPNGTVQSFGSLVVDREWVLVEGGTAFEVIH